MRQGGVPFSGAHTHLLLATVFVYVSSSVTSALGGELEVRWGKDKPQGISLDVDSGAGFPWK